MSIDLSVHSCLADVEDLMGPLHAWPVWARELLLKQHLSDSERYTLTLFVMGNKLPPFTYARFLRANGSLKDRRACEHVIDQLRRYQTGRNSGQCTYWDIDLKQLMPIGCAVVRGAEFWEPAFSRLHAEPQPGQRAPMTTLTPLQRSRIERNRAEALRRQEARLLPPAHTAPHVGSA